MNLYFTIDAGTLYCRRLRPGFLTLSGGLISSTSLLTYWIQLSSTTSLTLAMDTLGIDPCLSNTIERPVHELPVWLLKKSLSLSSELSLSAKCSAHHLSWFWTINYNWSASEYWFGYSTVASLMPPHTYVLTHTLIHTQSLVILWCYRTKESSGYVRFYHLLVCGGEDRN